METLAQWTLSNLSLYGIPLLLLVAYVGSLGIPFPITLVIVGAGALIRAGVLDGWAAAACAAGAFLADNSEFLAGRLARGWLARRFGARPVWRDALARLDRQGGWAILLTRFWLTPLAPAVNVIAGSRYPYARFLLFDLAGEALWVLLYGGLGYVFAAQWQQVSQAIGGFTALSLLALGMAGGVFLIRRKSGRVYEK